MEMPISVMIVLFVALAVGMLVLQLSNQILGRGEEQIRQFEVGCEEGVDFFIETAAITNTQVVNLAKICYYDHLGKYDETTICYILHGNLEASQSEIENASELVDDQGVRITDEVDFSNAGKTLYISFDELNQKVDITG